VQRLEFFQNHTGKIIVHSSPRSAAGGRLGVVAMPITPHFTIGQTETHVTIEIAVPHIRVRDVETVLTDDDSVLHFASSPTIYLLVLSFAPHQFVPDPDDGTACCRRAQFDPLLRHGTVRLELQKKDIGHWDDLDLIGRLQAPSLSQSNKEQPGTKRNGNWLVAVESYSSNAEGEQEEELTVVDQVNGWYGFARMFQGVFTDLARDGLAREMLELPWNEDHDGVSIISNNRSDVSLVHLQRRLERLQMEQEKFCPERYLGDTFGCHDDYLYQCAMAMKPHWTTALNTADETSSSSHYDQQAQSLMLSIPYPLLPKNLQHDSLMLPLIDILFAYVYDHLLTDGDPTVESAWTVSTLSATLAALEDWGEHGADTTRQVVESCIRRSLVYPYLRTYEFALHVLDHVVQILRRGLRTVIRCFLQVRRILDRSELYYLGNKVFIDPYLAWLQKSNNVNFDELMMIQAGEMEQIVAQSLDLKEAIGLGLAAIENGVAATSASSIVDDVDDAGSSSSSDEIGPTSVSVESTADEFLPAFVTELSNLRIDG
jgi:protein SHQ1